MEYYSYSHFDKHLIRAGNLIVDLGSFEEGLKVEVRYRKDIWDYIQYRESLNVWPTSNLLISMVLK